MNSIKYGIKLWSNNLEDYDEAVILYKENKFDYLELLFIPGNDDGVEVFIENNMPVVAHSPTFNQQVFFANRNFEKNNKLLQEIINFAKKLNSEEIILHPEIGNSDHLKEFLKLNKEKKLIIENMPKKAIDGTLCIGYSYEGVKEFLEIGNFDFCLDFGHAIKSAMSQGINYKDFLKKMISLNPKIAHICDGVFNKEEDEHLNIGEGEFDFKFISELIKNSNIEKITFEVPKKNGLKNYIKNINLFKKFME